MKMGEGREGNMRTAEMSMEKDEKGKTRKRKKEKEGGRGLKESEI